jgi:hypothetical protein
MYIDWRGNKSKTSHDETGREIRKGRYFISIYVVRREREREKEEECLLVFSLASALL